MARGVTSLAIWSAPVASVAAKVRVLHVSCVALAAVTSHSTTPLRKLEETGTVMRTTLASRVVLKPEPARGAWAGGG